MQFSYFISISVSGSCQHHWTLTDISMHVYLALNEIMNSWKFRDVCSRDSRSTRVTFILLRDDPPTYFYIWFWKNRNHRPQESLKHVYHVVGTNMHLLKGYYLAVINTTTYPSPWPQTTAKEYGIPIDHIHVHNPTGIINLSSISMWTKVSPV